MSSGAPGAASPSPCRNNNYDFTLRYERIKLLERVLFQFDTNMKRTSQAMRDLSTCFTHIGDSYEEVALCVSYATGGSAATLGTLSQYKTKAGKAGTEGGVPAAASAFQDQEKLKAAANMFCTEARRMRDGECYVEFNEGVHKDVLSRLNEVHTQARKAIQIGERADEALKKFNKANAIVDKKIAKYERLGRPLTESKRYKKQKKTRDDAEAVFDAKAALFDENYQSLMQTKLSVTGACIDSFLDHNLTYLCHLMQILGCLAPNGPRIIDDMIENARQLGQRIGVPEANLLASATHPSRVGANGRSRSAHNFTSFYCNRNGGESVHAEATQRSATRNKRATGEPSAAAKATAERRGRSPSVRVPEEPAVSTARAPPCQPRSAARHVPAPAQADVAERSGSNAPFGDTPTLQHKARPPQSAAAQPEPTSTPSAEPTPAVTQSNTPAAAAMPTREPSHEPFASSVAAPRRANTSATPIERKLFNEAASATPGPASRPAAAAPSSASARLRVGTAAATVDTADEPPMRPTTATTVFDFPSIPSVSTATPANSQWATRMTGRHTGGCTASAPSAPPADEDDENEETAGRVSARQAGSGALRRGTNAAPVMATTGLARQPVQAFVPSSAVEAPPQFPPFAWPDDEAALGVDDHTEGGGRPTVSASSLLVARAKVATQPLPHWQEAGVRPSVTSVPDLPSKASLSAASHSARSEGGPALTPAAASTGTATPVPPCDWDGPCAHTTGNGEGLVSISWDSPKAD